MYGLWSKEESAKETRKEQPRVWEKRREARRVSCDKHHMVRVGEPLSAA